MEDASYFTEFTNMCLKNTEIFDVNAFFLGWHDWVCHMARCWKPFFEYPAVMQQFLCKSWFLAWKLSIPRILDHYVDWWHLTACQWTNLVPALLQLHLETIHSGKPWINISCFQSKVNLQSFTFLEDKGESLETHIFGMQKLPIFRGLHHNGSQARHLSVLQELLLHPWVVPALSTTQVGVPFVGIFWVWPGAKTRIYLHTSAAQEWQTKWDVQQKRLEDLRFWKCEDTFSTWF